MIPKKPQTEKKMEDFIHPDGFLASGIPFVHGGEDVKGTG